MSRVVNGSPRVSPRSREAVLKAIEELGYAPNRAARQLVTRRTDTVALVVAESDQRLFHEPYFAGIIRGWSSCALTWSFASRPDMILSWDTNRRPVSSSI